MSDSLLGILNLLLLALLYLFLLRVVWAVWSEVRTASPPAPRHQAAGRTAVVHTKKRHKKAATELRITAPDVLAGQLFHVAGEMTVGRAAGCSIPLPDDTFISHLHARVFERDGETWVEDLGSTNGTYVNGHRITSPTPVRRGDSLQVGSTVLEAS